MFAHYGTAMNYLGYLKNFCEGENLCMTWLDNSVSAWRKGAGKLLLANGFKHINKRVPFTWCWIKGLVSNFDRCRMARYSLFVLVCWEFLLRPLSEACPMLVGGEQDTGSLPDGKHSGIWLDREGRVNLRLLKRKHRPRGSLMLRPHTCGGLTQRASFCLACRLKITLAQTSYGEVLFPAKPSKIMQDIKANSLSLSFNPEGISWKSFRAGHATHLAACGCDIKLIMAAGEWKSRAFLDYIDADMVDKAVFLHTTLDRSDDEDEAEEEETRSRQKVESVTQQVNTQPIAVSAS